MNASPTDLSSFRHDSVNHTYLGQICGSEKRFRDRYEILKVIGRGGFGITFLAKDVSLPGQPLCVIKQLCPKTTNEASLHRARQRFEQEAKTLSKLGSHSQIPQLLNYFEVEGEFYLVQEYVRGDTLTKEIRRSGLFSELGVKRFLKEFLPLLQYVHNNGVIHRDIKPSNIIRCRDDGRLVLIDFGAVKEQIVQREGSGFKPVTTQFVGTIGFAPPEQLASRPVYASDIYAVGITCLYLLSGRSPLEFDYEALTGEINWYQHVLVSDHLRKVLSRMIKNAPQDRYQSPQEIVRALDLEPHLDDLMYCMSVNPKPFRNSNQQSLALSSEGYVPPMVRRAMEIRDWQARMKARKARHDRFSPPVTYSG